MPRRTTDHDPLDSRRVTVEETGDGITIVCVVRKWIRGAFLALMFAVLVLAASADIVRDARLQKGIEIGDLAGLGIFAPILLALAASALLPFESLTLSRDGLKWRRRILPSRASIPLAELRKFRAGVDTRFRVNGQHYECLEWIATSGRVRCFHGLTGRELKWIARRLNDELRELGGGGRVERPIVDEEERPLPDRMLEPSASGPPKPPAGSHWRRIDDPRAIVFQNRGRPEWGGLLFFLAFNAIWTGGVGLATLLHWGVVGPPQQLTWGEWLGIGAFLLPWQLIMLLALTGLFAHLLEPARTTRWTFTFDAIELKHAWFGIGPWFTWPVTRLKGLKRRGEKQKQLDERRGAISPGFWPARHHRFAHRLVFLSCEVDPDGRPVEICQLRRLSARDVRWIAQTLFHERPEWFLTEPS